MSIWATRVPCASVLCSVLSPWPSSWQFSFSVLTCAFNHALTRAGVCALQSARPHLSSKLSRCLPFAIASIPLFLAAVMHPVIPLFPASPPNQQMSGTLRVRKLAPSILTRRVPESRSPWRRVTISCLSFGFPHGFSFPLPHTRAAPPSTTAPTPVF